MGEIREIVRVDIDKLIPYINNAKQHSESQILKLASSIREFGFVNPVLIDKNFNIIAGHGRVMAARKLEMKEVPCLYIEGLTEAQRKAYILADNRLGEFAEWDMDLVTSELEALQELDFDIDLTGFALPELLEEPEIEEDQVPDYAEERCKPGDVWKLGEHRLICGDSTDPAVVDRLMDGVKADMVFTDPPYGVGFESKGILNDNQNDNELVEFNKKWIPLSFDALKENGSWYCWGVDTSLMDIYGFILRPMIKQNKITFRNLLTWDKGLGQNQNDENMRSYPAADEKCLFVMCGVQGFNNNQDNYFEEYEPIRKYLESEAQKAQIDARKLKEICGVGMFSHWFTKSQWDLMKEEHYNKIQQYCVDNSINAFGVEFGKIKKQYDEIKKQYDEIKKQWYDTRAYFDNTHDNMNNVWHFNRTSGQERVEAGGHATPKPIALCSRAIKSSSREGEIVLDVFGGSGSTLIACEQLNRKCYMCELDPHYCDVIIQRWENYTGEKAVLLTS